MEETRQIRYVEIKRPSEKRIGARIRVVAEHLDEAGHLFTNSGFEPLYVEHRSDGNASFWFEKMPENEMSRLLRAIPDYFYALRATVR